MGSKPLNVNSLIKQVVYQLSALMRKKINLKTNLTDRELQIMGDWTRMGQVVATLVEYGNMWIREHGTITIETKLVSVAGVPGAGSGCALVSITSADAADLQEPADRSLFSTIIGIIKNHNGSVRMLNQGGKAEFNIYLPLLAPGS